MTFATIYDMLTTDTKSVFNYGVYSVTFRSGEIHVQGYYDQMMNELLSVHIKEQVKLNHTYRKDEYYEAEVHTGVEDYPKIVFVLHKSKLH